MIELVTMSQLLLPVSSPSIDGNDIYVMQKVWTMNENKKDFNFSKSDMESLNTIIREEEEHICWAEKKNNLTNKEKRSYDRACRRLKLLLKIRDMFEFLDNNPGIGIFNLN